MLPWPGSLFPFFQLPEIHSFLLLQLKFPPIRSLPEPPSSPGIERELSLSSGFPRFCTSLSSLPVPAATSAFPTHLPQDCLAWAWWNDGEGLLVVEMDGIHCLRQNKFWWAEECGSGLGESEDPQPLFGPHFPHLPMHSLWALLDLRSYLLGWTTCGLS